MTDFNGTLFYVWKGNRPCRIYVADGRVYFIGRKTGGDDDSTPDQLLAKHADSYALAAADIVDPRIEPKGKMISFGPNAGRWHFTRRGEDKETVVLFESSADASHAVFLLGGLLGSRLRNDSGIAGAPPPARPSTVRAAPGSGTDLVTSIPLPKDQAEIVQAMNNLTKLLGDRAPASCQKFRCEVRAAGQGSARPLEIMIGEGDRPGEGRPDTDPAVYDAAIRLARKLSSSIKTFPGVAIEMDRVDQGRWHINMKLMDKR